MVTLAQMTLDELKMLETIRFRRYTDHYNHAGMDAVLRADFDEVRNEIEKRLKLELICGPPVDAAGSREQTAHDPPGELYAGPVSVATG
jgi:hypothetical protein